MNTTAPAGPVTIAVPTERAVAYLKWVPFVVWAVCLGGLGMGYFVAQAGELRSAKYTMLGGLPGWPEVWGLALMGLGVISILGRLVGARALCWRRARVDGIGLAVVAMYGMCCWYSVFAASLWLGTAAYGFVPYLTIAASHYGLGRLLWATQGVRLHPPQVPRE